MRPKKYQPARLAQFLIASAFIFAALLLPIVNRAAGQILVGLSVSPADPIIEVSQSKQFTATGLFNDGSSQVLNGQPGTWASAGSMVAPRYYHTATRLPDGSVLIAGGYNSATTLATAERYDPATGSWTPAGAMAIARLAHTATLLPNGKVLVAGGINFPSNAVTSTTEIYDPAVNSWSAGPALSLGPRAFHAAVALDNGKVMVVAGLAVYACAYRADAELYNSVTNSWTSTGPLTLSRSSATAARLNDGRVLLAGGPQSGCPTPNNALNEAELYNPATGLWSVLPNLSINRSSNFIATMPNGKVLLAGGRTVGASVTSTTDIFNPATSSFSPTTSLSIARATSGGTGDNGATVVLPDGRVMVAGGHNDVTAFSSVELFNPSTSTWSTTGSLLTARTHNTITLLGNGQVLVVGGAVGATPLASAEVYRAPVIWSSSNSAVATIDQNGFATAVALGTTTISAASGSTVGSTTLTVAKDQLPPATTASYAAPNANGWHSTDVVVQLNATDSGGPVSASGVQSITYSLSGAQNGAATINGSSVSFAVSNEGTTTVSYQATDHNGNVEPSTTITINLDKTRPTLSGLPNLTANATSGAGAVVMFTPVALDAVSGVDSVTVTQGLASGSTFPHGITNVEVTAVDKAGNSWSQSFSVTVIKTLTSIEVAPPTATINNGVNTQQFVATGGYTDGSSQALGNSGNWTPAGSLTTARMYHTATRLPDGSVLVAGGYNGVTIFASAERYYPTTHTWASAGSMAIPRIDHTATLLPNGKVLVAGGRLQTQSTLTNTTEIYDPATNTWSAGPPLTLGVREAHSAVLLNNGKVLIAAGLQNYPDCTYRATAELYDPSTNAWSATGSLHLARSSATTILLANGKVLLAAGPQNNCPTPNVGLNQAEVYDPATGAWTVTGNLSVSRYGNSITVLPSGRVLLAGGISAPGFVVVASADIYDPISGTFSPTGAMATARMTSVGSGDNGVMPRLADGRVLFAGGHNPWTNTFFSSSELFDPISGTWSPTGSLNTARTNHTVTTLDDGTILAVGGMGAGSVMLGGAEIYTPPAVSWSSSNPGVASINQSGIATGGANGTTTITASAGAISGTAALTVDRTAPTTTTVNASPNPSAYGQSVTFTATVTSGATPVPQGSVTFKDGGLIVSGPTNLNALGQAAYNVSSLSVASHIITAEYSGDPAFFASSGSTNQTINKANSQTTVSSSANPSVFGQSVTLTATVAAMAPGAGTPAGSVQFRDGGFNIDFAVPLVNGVASIQTSQLGIGPHSISADYSGDGGFHPSTGNLSQTINKGDTLTTVSSSPNPSQSGQGITFSAAVTAMSPAAGIPTGSVQFKDNGSPFGGPTPVNLGVATSFPFNLGVGSHTITAEFSGDFRFNLSSGSSNHVVNKADTTTTLTSFQNPSNATQFASFLVRVGNVAQPFSSINEGTVTINEGGAVIAGPFGLDGAGNANINVSTLGAGTHLLTAQYSGSNNFNSSGSAIVTQTVNALTPFININTNTFTYDGNSHPATASVSGQNNAPVNGTFTFTYSPGGASAPVNAGSYGVTATFTSNDPNYSNAVASVGPTPGGGTWTTRANMPNARYGPPSAVINNKIYVAGGCCVGGGSSITRFNALDVYDQQNNSWTSKAPIPIGVYGAGAAAINNIFYVAAGQQAGGNIANLQAYDPATDTWSVKTPMPDASGGVGATVVNNQMYVIGGMNPGNTVPVNLVRRYDPTSNSWTARAAMTTPRVFMGVAAQNNRIYVVGGYSSVGSPLSTLEVYDANSNSWSTKAPMPTARYGLTVEFLNGTFYAIGGNGGVGGVYQPLATVETYDPNTDTWTTPAPAPETHYLAGGGQVFGTLYLIGGLDASAVNSGRNDAFSPDRLLRINKRQPQLSATGGTFLYNALPHPATGTATGVGGVAVPGTFAFNYSTVGNLAPVTPGSYSANGVFTSADANYQSGGTAFANIQINRQAAIVDVPADITVEADDEDGAQVSYVVSAHDVDGPVAANCSPSSGSFFNGGTTTVNCTAQGLNSSQGFGSFHVIVNVPTIVSIAVTTDDGQSSASVNIDDTKQFVATATFSNGDTQSTAGDHSGGSGDGGGGSGGGSGSGGNGGSNTPNVGFWNVHFLQNFDVTACGIPGAFGFTSQAFSVDSTGLINNTQWSPQTPSVNVTGQVTAAQVTLTISCINNATISTTAILPWQTTSFDGPITFSGHTTSAHVTGWSAQPPMPTAGFALGAATVGNKLYVLGGGGNSGPGGLVQVFDLTTRTWLAPAASMSPREGPGVAALNGYIYAAGGHMPGGEATNIFQRFDPVANQWLTLAPMLGPRAELQLVAANGKLYAIGGQAGNGSQPSVATVEQYDPVADAWVARAPMSSPRSFFAAGDLNNGTTIIVAGGGGGSSVELYDIATNTWSATSPLQVSMASGATIANRFYVATQCGSFVYRPVNGTLNEGWAIMPSMLHPRGEFAVAVSGDVMYAAGGLNGSGPSSGSVATFDALSTPPPGDLAYSQSGATGNCFDNGGGGGDDDDGPTWRIVDPVTHQDSTIASIDENGLATGLAVGTALVVAEVGGVSCLDSNECATLTVVDAEPPTITVPASVTAEATSPDGAIVDPGQATGSDVVGPVTITRSPEGNQFALGTTPIVWRATDGAGNFSEATSHVTVVDTTAPGITEPADVTAEATSADGALVNPGIAIGSDLAGAVTITRTPEGNQFAIGTTLITWIATDAHGNFSQATSHVTVVDTTSPVITAPADVTAEATSGAGASVDPGQATGSDLAGPVTITRSPEGNQFALGTTPIIWRATDAYGNFSEATSQVTVVDTTSPSITVPADVTVDATSGAGASVDPGQATGSDLVGAVTITRSPQGNQFAIGTTTITWRATDGAGNFSEAAQHVTVVSTALPILSLPGNITVDATNPQGAIVMYSASATNGVGGSLAVTCSKASGSMFPIGTTIVACSATDAAGNSALGSFTVLVQAAAAQVSQLSVTVQGFNLQQGISNSLDAKLANVLSALNGATTGNTAAVCNQLGAFINETRAQSGKKLTVAQANQLIAAAQQIQAVIGCQ